MKEEDNVIFESQKYSYLLFFPRIKHGTTPPTITQKTVTTTIGSTAAPLAEPSFGKLDILILFLPLDSRWRPSHVNNITQASHVMENSKTQGAHKFYLFQKFDFLFHFLVYFISLELHRFYR